MEAIAYIDDCVSVGDKIIHSPVGEGTLTDLTERGYPRVNHIAVVWCMNDQGMLFDPHHKAPEEIRALGERVEEERKKVKPQIDRIMQLIDSREKYPAVELASARTRNVLTSEIAEKLYRLAVHTVVMSK